VQGDILLSQDIVCYTNFVTFHHSIVSDHAYIADTILTRKSIWFNLLPTDHLLSGFSHLAQVEGFAIYWGLRCRPDLRLRKPRIGCGPSFGGNGATGISIGLLAVF